jgi:hypothetical protein
MESREMLTDDTIFKILNYLDNDSIHTIAIMLKHFNKNGSKLFDILTTYYNHHHRLSHANIKKYYNYKNYIIHGDIIMDALGLHKINSDYTNVIELNGTDDIQDILLNESKKYPLNKIHINNKSIFGFNIPFNDIINKTIRVPSAINLYFNHQDFINSLIIDPFDTTTIINIMSNILHNSPYILFNNLVPIYIPKYDLRKFNNFTYEFSLEYMKPICEKTYIELQTLNMENIYLKLSFINTLGKSKPESDKLRFYKNTDYIMFENEFHKLSIVYNNEAGYGFVFRYVQKRDECNNYNYGIHFNNPLPLYYTNAQTCILSPIRKTLPKSSELIINNCILLISL